MPSRDELREELAELKFSGYSQCLIQLNDRELDLVMSLIDQQIREARKGQTQRCRRQTRLIDSAEVRDEWFAKEAAQLSTKPQEGEGV